MDSMRMECLKLAISLAAPGASIEDIIAAAAKLLSFIYASEGH